MIIKITSININLCNENLKGNVLVENTTEVTPKQIQLLYNTMYSLVRGNYWFYNYVKFRERKPYFGF